MGDGNRRKPPWTDNVRPITAPMEPAFRVMEAVAEAVRPLTARELSRKVEDERHEAEWGRLEPEIRAWAQRLRGNAGE